MDTIQQKNSTNSKQLKYQLGAYLKLTSKFSNYLDEMGCYYKKDQPFTISSSVKPCFAAYYLPAFKIAVEIERNPLPASMRDKHSDELLLAEQGILTIRLERSDIHEGCLKQLAIGKILFDRAGYMVLNNDFTVDDMSRHLLLDINDVMNYAKNFSDRQGLPLVYFFRPWLSKSIDKISLTGYHLLYNRAIPIYAINKLMFSGELTCIDSVSKLNKLQISDERKAYTEKVLQSQEAIIMQMFPDLPKSFISEHKLF